MNSRRPANEDRALNIVLLMADQLRADFLSCYGASFIHTPHIDSLANEGVRYRRAVAPSPVCVPARASLLTGDNAIRNGVLDNDHWLHPSPESRPRATWPQLLTARGYHTEAIGKMHFTPWDASEGFQHRIIAEDKRHIDIQDDYQAYLQRHGYRKYHGIEHEGYFDNKGAITSLIPAEHQVDVWTADQTCAFLDQYGAQAPFALMVGFPGPHCPYDPPSDLVDLFHEEAMPASIGATVDSDAFRQWMIDGNKRAWNQVDYSLFEEHHKRKLRVHYAALVHQIDSCVGRILESLERNGLADSTVIIFCSDHGDLLGDFDLIGKQLFYEPSTRVPLIIRHPRGHQGRVVQETVSLTDLHSTLLAIAGVPAHGTSDSRPLPGAVPGRSDGEGAGTRDYVFGVTALGSMLTDDRWKLCKYRSGSVHLFDLEGDPLEQRNLAADPGHRSRLRELDAVMFERLLSSLAAAFGDQRTAPAVAGR